MEDFSEDYKIIEEKQKLIRLVAVKSDKNFIKLMKKM